MSIIDNAERLSAADLARHVDDAWQRQRDYVATNSAFYRALWQGRTPPRNLRDLPALPLVRQVAAASVAGRSILPSATTLPRRAAPPTGFTAHPARPARP